MTDNLVSYQSMYATLSAEITANICKIEQIGKDKSPETADNAEFIFDQIDKNFEESDDLFEQMGLEINSLPSEDRSKHMTQLESFKAEQKRLKKEFQSSKRRFQRTFDRSIMLDGETMFETTSNDVVTNAKQKLLENTESLERASRKLDIGQQLLHETEAIGASVLNDLSHQKEVLFRSRNRLRETDEDLSTGSRVLSRMISRAQQSKIVLALVIVCVITAISVGIYFSFVGS